MPVVGPAGKHYAARSTVHFVKVAAGQMQAHRQAIIGESATARRWRATPVMLLHPRVLGQQRHRRQRFPRRRPIRAAPVISGGGPRVSTGPAQQVNVSQKVSPICAQKNLPGLPAPGGIRQR